MDNGSMAALKFTLAKLKYTSCQRRILFSLPKSMARDVNGQELITPDDFQHYHVDFPYESEDS